MFAVGTVVMNRLADPHYPKSICGVVGQKNQFAPGVLYKPMKEKRSYALASRVADAVMSGARHRGVRMAKHFHTAGLRFPYRNMHYVLEAGGNEFYEKY
jgi:spore germination cell wall hydrolase CwlJ-like protein